MRSGSFGSLNDAVAMFNGGRNRNLIMTTSVSLNWNNGGRVWYAREGIWTSLLLPTYNSFYGWCNCLEFCSEEMIHVIVANNM